MATMGLLPPQAIDAEEYVLCSLLNEPNSFHRISSWISDESFYKEDHKKIFQAIARLHAKSQEVDIITVAQSLKQSGDLELVGGNYRIVELNNIGSQSANIERHSLIIQQKYLQREMIAICSGYMKQAYDDSEDIFELYDNLGNDLFKKVAVNVGKQAIVIGDILKERIVTYQEPSALGLSGLGTGFTSIDRHTGGWQPQDLIIIAARPSMGKTAFVLNTARHAAITYKTPVAIFSLEMSKEQLVDRIVSAETDVYFGNIRHRKLNEEENWKIMSADALVDSKIFIDDTAQLSIQAFRSKAIRLKHKHDIGLIVIDYLQLMRGERDGKGGNREQEIGSISRGIKAVAKELNIPVIALSQLSRALESRPGAHGKRPILSDLRESGSIEQDADMVGFLFRPEYYGIDEDEQGRSLAGLCEVIIAKNRNGETGIPVLKFNGAFMRFSEIEDHFQPVQPQIFDNPVITPTFQEVVINPTTPLSQDEIDKLYDGDAPF